MRKKLKTAENILPPEIRIFQSSGWLSPQPVMESPNENALAPPQTSTAVTGLEPFTEYEFYVLAVNMAGSISSDWASGRTGEAGKYWFEFFLIQIKGKTKLECILNFFSIKCV